MKAILQDGIVLANVGDAQIVSEGIMVGGTTYVGPEFSLVETEDPAPIGHIYRNNKFQQLMNTQELAASVLTRFMDEFAQEKNYDDIKSAALRAGYPGPFQTEGVKYAQWMDNCWDTSYAILASIEKGLIPIPTKDELIEMMPAKPKFN